MLQAVFPYPYSDGANPTEMKRNVADDGHALCRLKFDSNRFEDNGSGWRTDWPRAEQNLQIRFGEMTTAHTAERPDGTPIHWIVEATSAAIHHCPLLLASDVGTLVWTDEEVPAMRDYLARGGFLWVDDFWGLQSWSQWVDAFAQVVPRGTIKELLPGHPLFGMYYNIDEVPQISSLNFWNTRGGRTDERGEESPRGELYGGYDEKGHIVVLMTFNTDIADAAEREADSPAYFQAFASDGYGFMINLLLYIMSHP